MLARFVFYLPRSRMKNKWEYWERSPFGCLSRHHVVEIPIAQVKRLDACQAFRSLVLAIGDISYIFIF